MAHNDVYIQLAEEFEHQLNRTLTEKEKCFIQWMADRQVRQDAQEK